MATTTQNERLLRALALELRHELEGSRDASGRLQPGDLERRLAAIGVRRDRPPVDPAALPQLTPEDRAARKIVDAYLASRAEAGATQPAAVQELIRNTAYSWANRLLALRCMEARALIDEVILQKEIYGGRSLKHHRLTKKQPERCTGEDDGLFAVLLDEFAEQARSLPLVFDPTAPEIALRPSVAALKRCLAILSGTEPVKGHGLAKDEVFLAPDALGWAYQDWNVEEKNRIFAMVAGKRGAKIGGADLIPATCIYTPSYMVEFLVQNSLGALWMGMHPRSRLREGWPYYVDQAAPMSPREKRVKDISFLDPACGSGHFLLVAFDLFYAMYEEEGEITEPAQISASILEHNLYGIDIDERAVQIAALALVMKARERAPELSPRVLNLVATNIHLPAGKAHVDAFLRKHPEDASLRPALSAIFGALAHADELGALVQIEEPLDRELRALRAAQNDGVLPMFGPRTDDEWVDWKRDVLARLRKHFDEEVSTPDLAAAFFGEAASKGLSLVDLVTRRYDVVGMNPPYLGFRKLERHIKDLVTADDLAKLDLYVAFLSRFFTLLHDGGSLAAVSPSSWTTSSGTSRLRRKMLDEGGPRIVAALGQYTFSEAPLLFVSLQVISRGSALEEPVLVTLRPAQSGEEGLLAAVQRGAKRWPHGVILGLETLPFLPVAPLELLQKAKSQPTVGEFFSFIDGVWTGSNDRDIREAWEVRPGGGDWIPISGGQGYSRWYAPLSRRIRVAEVEKWPARAARAFGLEYARVAGGKLAARVVGAPSAAMAGIVSILPNEGVDPLRLFEAAAVFNSRLGTVWLRTLTSGLNFNPGYAARIPLASRPPSAELRQMVEQVVARKRALAEGDITCDDFSPPLFELSPASSPAEGIAARAARFSRRALEDTVQALELENVIERMLKDHFAISDEAWRELDLELGKPAGALPAEAGTSLRDRVPSAGMAEELEEDEADEGESRPTLPAESHLETLARTYGVHPRVLLTATDLPPALIAAIAGQQTSHRRTFVQDYLSLLVLRLFGYRWPSERDGTTASAELTEAVADGIIPLAGASERTLFDRVLDRLALDFPGVGGAAVEPELSEILGKPLERWLEADLFRHHLSRFGKRPIVWQLQSARYSATKKPAFAALLYYHRLDSDTLPKIRSQYLGPLRLRLETELAGIEAVRAADRSRVQAARQAEIESAQEELRAFDARLEQVIEAGFASASLDTIVAKEPLDAWTSRDGRAPPPASRDAFAAQERRYEPDHDDGVRVNLAPLQRAGVLAVEVLAGKDVDRAIADRAEWRAIERSRCREQGGGAPRWWPALQVEPEEQAPAGPLGIRRLEIRGFQSLREVVWEPGRLNVIIGPNGSGKSNLMRALSLLQMSAKGDLGQEIIHLGGIAPLLWDGQTQEMSWLADTMVSEGGRSTAFTYDLLLKQLAGGSAYRIERETLTSRSLKEPGPAQESKKLIDRQAAGAVTYDSQKRRLVTYDGSLPAERTLLSSVVRPFGDPTALPFGDALAGWSIYHDLRVDQRAPLRQAAVTRMERRVSADGQNLIPVLHTLYVGDREFKRLTDAAMGAAFGEEYEELTFAPAPAADQRIQLRIKWRSLQTAQPAAALSDGTLRFLLLIAILGSPDPGALIAIDEPEMGLHPGMLSIVAELAQGAADRAQVMMTTHSPQFLDAFADEPPTTTVAQWVDGATRLSVVDGDELRRWLEKFSLGALFRSGELEGMV